MYLSRASPAPGGVAARHLGRVDGEQQQAPMRDVDPSCVLLPQPLCCAAPRPSRCARIKRVERYLDEELRIEFAEDFERFADMLEAFVSALHKGGERRGFAVGTQLSDGVHDRALVRGELFELGPGPVIGTGHDQAVLFQGADRRRRYVRMACEPPLGGERLETRGSHRGGVRR